MRGTRVSFHESLIGFSISVGIPGAGEGDVAHAVEKFSQQGVLLHAHVGHCCGDSHAGSSGIRCTSWGSEGEGRRKAHRRGKAPRVGEEVHVVS